MMMKKGIGKVWVISILLLVILIGVSAIGCQNTNLSSGKGSKSLPGKLENPNVSLLLYAGRQKIEEEFTDAIDVFEKQYGGKVNIDYATFGDEYRSKIVMSINAGDSYDVVRWTHTEMPQYAILGILEPIDEYFDMNDPLWQSSSNMAEITLYNGKRYGMPGGSQVKVVYFNQTLFENNGLKTPIEYYKEGNWNWEILKELGIKLTQDTTRDGVIDQWGINGNPFGIEDLGLSNGTDMVRILKDGIIEHNFNDSHLIAAMQFYADAYTKYNYAHTVQNEVPFVEGKVAMHFAWDERAHQFSQKEMKYAYDFVPYPTGPNGQTGASPGGGGFWGMTAGTKNPQGGAALIYLRKKFEKENQEQFLSEFYSQEQVDRLLALRAGIILLPKASGIGSWTQITNRSVSADLRNGASVTATIDKYLPQYQEQIRILMQK